MSRSHTSYQDFIARKATIAVPTGITTALDLPASLAPFQADIASWSCRRGRAAVFADTGLGKTRMGLAWGYEVVRHTRGRVLILAPLAVAQQTVDGWLMAQAPALAAEVLRLRALVASLQGGSA